MNREFVWTDPFDDISDEELDDQVAKLLRSRQSSVAISLRVSRDLLGRVKREAARAGIPYQTFMKGVLEAGIARIERGAPRSKRPTRTAARR
ncbi:MAG: CopG family antitoxin [Chloroflexota bacterium]